MRGVGGDSAHDAIAVLGVPDTHDRPMGEVVLLDGLLAPGKGEQHVEVVGFEAEQVGEFVAAGRIARQVEWITDSRFENEFHSIAADVTGSAISSVGEQDVCIL